MICQNCGSANQEGSKFCTKCGAELPIQQPNVNQMGPIPNQASYSFNAEGSQNASINPINQKQPKSINKITMKEYFYIVLAVILKPFTAFKEEISKFDNFKNSVILSGIVAILATIISLLKTIYNTVRVTSIWTKETQWVWENLKEVNYIKVIGMNLLIYLGIIAAIASVYYIASLIAKKQTNFPRLLGIAAASIVPILVCSMILSPILSMIYVPLGMIISVVGGVYTVILIYETINNEILLEGNAKFYFNLICLSILIVTVYYLYTKTISNSIIKNAGDLLDLLK